MLAWQWASTVKTSSMNSSGTNDALLTAGDQKEQEQKQAFHAQVTQLYQAGYSALIGMPAAAVVLFLALKDQLPTKYLVIWLACIIGISAMRGICLHAFNMRSPDSKISTWFYFYCAIEVLSGLAWGGTGFFISYVEIEHQLLIYFALIGMVGGAIALLAPVYACYVCFSIPALVTFVVFLAQLHSDVYTYMIVLIVLAALVVTHTTRTLTRHIHRSYVLAFENENLTEQTLKSNQQLRDENTARHSYEEQLRASEARLSSILNNMQDTYFRTNVLGQIIIVSPSVKTLLGYTPEELLGTQISDLYVNPNGRDHMIRLVADNNGLLLNYQSQLVRKDGQLVWVATNAQYYFDSNNQAQGVEGTTRNIDDIQKYIRQLEISRKEYQNLYEINQNILEHSPIGILFIDKNSRFSYINSNMHEILGVPPNTRHHMLGQRFLEIPNLAKAGLSSFARQLLDGRRLSINIPYTSAYGKSTILSVTGVPLSENGQFAGAIVLAADITDKVHQEKQLVDALRKADDANQTKSRFLANISHELRTPLNAIIGMASLLKQSEQCAEHKESLDIIQHSGENLLSLVNTILTLTQLEQGSYQSEKELMNLSSYLFPRLRPYIDTAEQKNLEFIIEDDPDIPHSLIIDKHCIDSGILPLVDNAVKFTRTGHVKLTTQLLSQNHKAIIRFRIEDTGPGMSAEQVGKMFDYFSMADDASNRRHSGLGLGASIAKQLIENNGGSINVTCAPANGCVVEVTLPFDLPQDSVAH